MRKCLLYEHGGSANHGCEALVRTTCELLNLEPDQTILLSYHATDDKAYDLGSICDVLQFGERKPFNRLSPLFWKAYMRLRLKGDYAELEKLAYLSPLYRRRGDVAIHIGGDNYCYGDASELILHHEILVARRAKTILWGCSIEPELLQKESIAKDIARYDIVTARESITYDAVRKVNRNTILVSDSAFSLRTKHHPEFFNRFGGMEFVGINFSPLVEGYESSPGMGSANIGSLIERILEETDMGILLIPHVVDAGNDDREVLRPFLQRYEDTGRIYLIEDCGCEDLKGYISGCKLFVGSRTHATIAAYSSCVPTLTLGYSVKSRGIARDLFGTEEGYVVPIQTLTNRYSLAHAFWHLRETEAETRSHLEAIMPEYRQRVSKGAAAVRKLIIK